MKLSFNELRDLFKDKLIKYNFSIINPKQFSDEQENDILINEILSYFKSAETVDAKTKIYYPGEIVLNKKRNNIRNGIDIDERILLKVKDL